MEKTGGKKGKKRGEEGRGGKKREGEGKGRGMVLGILPEQLLGALMGSTKGRGG